MHTVDRGGTGYPTVLEDLRSPPRRLWVHGGLPDGPMVAVVGTRSPNREGLRFAKEIGAVLTAAGTTVVSGGASGIDGAAHEGALESGGPTVAVLGTGVDVAYPREHRALFVRIAARGALLSEFPPGTLPRRQHFPSRNRIVAALGVATIVVQAGARSGALSTARLAREIGRPVVVVPWSPFEPRGEGNGRLVRAGARVAWSTQDVLRALGLETEPTRARAPLARQVEPSPGGRRILVALDQEPMYLAEIVEETGLGADEVMAEILTLSVEGLVEEIDLQRFARARTRPNG